MRDILSLALVVSAIALPDSINPSLILTDFYLAAGRNPVRRTFLFVAAVFAVTFLGGLLIALGLGDLVRSLLPKLGAAVKYALIVAGGASLALGGVAIWVKREALADRAPKATAGKDEGQSAVLLGGGIAGVELLTAFPYFAAITIIAGSDASAPGKLILLGVYNLVYVLPLIGIVIVCAAMGPGATGFLNRVRDGAMSRWPVVVGPLAVALGIGLIGFGTLRLVGA